MAIGVYIALLGTIICPGGETCKYFNLVTQSSLLCWFYGDQNLRSVTVTVQYSTVTVTVLGPPPLGCFFTQPLPHKLTGPLFHSLVGHSLFIRSFVHSFIHSFVRSFIYSLVLNRICERGALNRKSGSWDDFCVY